MKRLGKVCLFLATLAVLQVGLAAAQSVAQGKPVKWETLSGKDREFMVSVPEGYIGTAKGEYYLGNPTAAPRVEKHLNVARYINGAVLIMDYYQGRAKDIYEILKEREKAAFEKEQEINGFRVVHYSVKTGKGFQKIHYYFKNKALYIVKAFARSEDDTILKAFFESVRLINQQTAVAPNAAPNAQSTMVPNLIEQEPVRLDDALAIDAKEADRPVITLKLARPNFTFDIRKGISNFHIRLKILYSSSGKVTNVEVLSSTSKLLEKEAVKAAKETVFIPAEKDGKLVSVYETVEIGFTTERMS